MNIVTTVISAAGFLLSVFQFHLPHSFEQGALCHQCCRLCRFWALGPFLALHSKHVRKTARHHVCRLPRNRLRTRSQKDSR